MPILETTEGVTPRSALRHRPLLGNGVPPNASTSSTIPPSPLVRRASRLRQPDTGDEVPEWKHADGSNIQGNETSKSTGPASVTSKLPPKASSAFRPATRARQQPLHPLLYLGVGMVVTVSVLAVVIIVGSWISTTLDDLHYGRPRTFQIDAYVGHNEAPGMPSHFIALNLHGRIEIIELPGGDATHARIYLGPQLYGPSADLVPVTLSFQDVNGDHLPDMIVHFQDTQVVFMNEAGGFRPARPDEEPRVEQFLQH